MSSEILAALEKLKALSQRERKVVVCTWYKSDSFNPRTSIFREPFSQKSIDDILRMRSEGADVYLLPENLLFSPLKIDFARRETLMIPDDAEDTDAT